MKLGSVLATVIGALVVIGFTSAKVEAYLGDYTDTLEVSILREETDAFKDSRTSGTAAVGDSAVGDTILVILKTRTDGTASEGNEYVEVGTEKKKLYVRFEKSANDFVNCSVKETATGKTFKFYYVIDKNANKKYAVAVYNSGGIEVYNERDQIISADSIKEIDLNIFKPYICIKQDVK